MRCGRDRARGGEGGKGALTGNDVAAQGADDVACGMDGAMRGEGPAAQDRGAAARETDATMRGNDGAARVDGAAAQDEGAPAARRRDVPAVVARIAVAAVFLLNVQCALQFVLWPAAFAPAYELSGVAGEAAVRGLGVAFLMWNATYPAVIASPRRFRALFAVVLAQQAIGLAGETAILLSLPAGHDVLAGNVLRFIAFDGAGLAVMLAAFLWLAFGARKW